MLQLSGGFNASGESLPFVIFEIKHEKLILDKQENLLLCIKSE